MGLLVPGLSRSLAAQGARSGDRIAAPDSVSALFRNATRCSICERPSAGASCRPLHGMAWSVGKLLDVAFFLAIGLATTAAAHGQSRDALADAARAFDEAALRADDDNAKPKPVRKWLAPIRLAFANPSAAPATRRDFAPGPRADGSAREASRH